MRQAIVTAAGALVLLLGCSTAVPSAAPSTAASPSRTPPVAPSEPAASPTTEPTEVPQLGLPLPEAVAGRPRPGDASVMIGAETTRGGLVPVRAYPYTLGHCGLGSPFDFDGSVWDPVAGHDGDGGPLTQPQIGELINATTGTVTLLDPDTAEFRSPGGAVITLRRLPGERAYALCM